MQNIFYGVAAGTMCVAIGTMLAACHLMGVIAAYLLSKRKEKP